MTFCTARLRRTPTNRKMVTITESFYNIIPWSFIMSWIIHTSKYFVFTVYTKSIQCTWKIWILAKEAFVYGIFLYTIFFFLVGAVGSWCLFQYFVCHPTMRCVYTMCDSAHTRGSLKSSAFGSPGWCGSFTCNVHAVMVIIDQSTLKDTANFDRDM